MKLRSLPLLALLLFGCRASAPVRKDNAYASAVEARISGDSGPAATAAWAYIATADPDDPRYDRALLLLAQTAEGLGLRYVAGMSYREIAQSRRNMDVVPEALRGLRRIVESGVYDDDALITGFIAAEAFGFLPDDLQDFVDYHRGLDLTRRGDDAWAEVHFDRIAEDSPYAQRAAYVRAVRLIADYDDDPALEILHEIAEAEDLPSDLRHDVERTMARIAFEHHHFVAALEHYEALRELAPNDPEILLETAWTHYYLGDSRKTIGLLIAVDAPIHSDFISPERYLLEALALRRLCQFGAAREAAVRLRKRHGDAQAALAEGVLPADVAELRAAARLRGRSAPHTRFMDSLEWERERMLGLRLSDELRAVWLDVYDQGLTEARRVEEVRLPIDLAGLTEELLAADEGVRLIVHELGVSMLRGRRRPDGVAEKEAEEVPISGERVFFPFTGEYWTDELDDLMVVAEDRCID